MADTYRWMARLCWALVVLAIIAAIFQIGVTLALFVPFPNIPNGTDLVTRLVTVRAADTQNFPFVAIGVLVSMAVYVIVGILGVALRKLATPGSGRDAMAVLFVISAAIGITAGAVNIAASQAATFSYCDCGYKTYEVIAQEYSLTMGFVAQQWIGLAAITLLGLAAWLAGRVVAVSSTWRALSFLIAALLLIGAALRLIAGFVFIEAFDPFQISDILVGLTAGILVPIWAAILARHVGRAAPMEPEAAAAV